MRLFLLETFSAECSWKEITKNLIFVPRELEYKLNSFHATETPLIFMTTISFMYVAEQLSFPFRHFIVLFVCLYESTVLNITHFAHSVLYYTVADAIWILLFNSSTPNMMHSWIIDVHMFESLIRLLVHLNFSSSHSLLIFLFYPNVMQSDLLLFNKIS